MAGQYHISRRGMLAGMTGAGLSLVVNPAWGADVAGLDPRVAGIVMASEGIDTHNHVDVPLAADQILSPDIDLAGDMKRSGLSAVCMTFTLDAYPFSTPGLAYDRFRNGLAGMDTMLQRNGMTRALTVADLKAAHRRGQPIAIQAVEGAQFLDGKLERLEEAHHRGLRHIGLLHEYDASPPLGDVYTSKPHFGGMTPLGLEAIRECNRLGIVIDMAHGSADSVDAALKASTVPILVSHTGLDNRLGSNAGLGHAMLPRLISATEAKKVADAGGLVGLWTRLTDTPAEFAQNVRAMVEVIGVDHVCIGTDTKLTMPGGRAMPAGQAAPPVFDLVRTNARWAGADAGFYYVLVDALLKAGFAPDEIGKIGGGNYQRLFGLVAR